MEHAEAQSSYNTERYLLDEMSDAERDAFEEHYFDCVVCGADVRAAEQLMIAGRRIARDIVHPPVLKPKRGWLGWVPQTIAASLISLFVGGYGAMQMLTPRAVATQPTLERVEPVDIIGGSERGVVPTYAENRPVVFRYTIVDPEPVPPPRYAVSVRDEDGEPVGRQVVVDADDAQEPVMLVLSALPRGSYRVVVEGVREDGNRLPVTDHHAFNVVETRDEGSLKRRQP